MGILKYLLLSIYFLHVQGYYLHKHPCRAVHCRPGRECRSEAGRPQCVCMIHCPQHWSPVCGSDGESYDSHCHLHRAACIQGSHISPLHPGSCRKKKKETHPNDIQHNEVKSHAQLTLPNACFEKDRNKMQEKLLKWFQSNYKHRNWYQHGMSQMEILWGHFYSLDRNNDTFGDSEEMFAYLDTDTSNSDDEHRQLCLDALVEEGDINHDWRLDFQEFKNIFSSFYKPSSKVCSLDGKNFPDEAETVVDCNVCVCACGKWICTSKQCSQKHEATNNDDVAASSFNQIQDESLDQDEYDEDNFEEDDEDPEDDPDVQDINWF